MQEETGQILGCGFYLPVSMSRDHPVSPHSQFIICRSNLNINPAAGANESKILKGPGFFAEPLLK